MTQKLYKKGIVDLFHDSFFYITWEQRKLSDCMDLDCGQDYKHLSKGNIPVYGTGGYMLSVDRALSYDKDGIGIGRKGTIDKPYLLKAPFWTVDTLFFAIPKKKNDLFFLLCLFSKIDWKSKDESTGVPSLSKQTINKVDVIIPQNHEQEVIGTFFQKIDNLITLHQCKCDTENAQSTIVFQNVFVKKMANAWEQRKLSDCMDLDCGQDYKHLSKGNIPVYGTGGYMLSVDRALSYDKDGIGIGRKGTIDKPYLLKAPFWTVDTLFFAIPKKKNDLFFLLCLFSKIDWKSKDESTGVPSLSKQTINKVDVIIPQNHEQEVIGTFFQKIDNLITLHQRGLITYIRRNIWQKKKHLLNYSAIILNAG